MNQFRELLKAYWQYDSFRPAQEEIITAVAGGRDTFALLPTGGGKSLCYQVPALAKPGFCLVISPLIALMQDQVMQLQKRGIEAAYLHSGMTRNQVLSTLDQAAQGRYKLLYVAPERVQTESFQAYAADFDLNLIAIDEAHCISQWGHDFRPAYRKLQLLKEFFPQTPTLALTASATPEVQQDILEQLQLNHPFIVNQSIVRGNLFYHVRYTENKPSDSASLFRQVKGSGILYCRSRKRCVETAIQLNHQGISSGVYHAGLTKEERDATQAKWTAASDMIVCATTAFGMGIDKPDVRSVLHYDAPVNPEEYYQEAGRAGRDGQEAMAMLLYNHNDIERLLNATDISFPPEEYIRKVYSCVGDYLQIPVHGGREELKAFDIVTFAENFHLEILPAISAVKILEREGCWIWNENTSTRTSIQFTTDRRTLNYLEQQEPKLAYVTTNLLRLYGSIYHHPTFIREFEDARMMRLEKPELDRRLQKLAALGVIDYQPAVTGSTLFWLQDRETAGNLVLNRKLMQRLRAAHRKRAEAMIHFMENETECRNKLLAAYFGEPPGADCGGCDNCRKRASRNFQPAREMKDILQIVLKKEHTTLKELERLLPEVPPSRIIDYIRKLSDEQLCRLDADGSIFAL